jgi:hypothetical protein
VTATVTRLVAEALPGTPAQALSLAVDGLVTILLIGLILARLLLQAGGGEDRARAVRVLDVATVPLLVVFAIFLYIRFEEILPLG